MRRDSKSLAIPSVKPLAHVSSEAIQQVLPALDERWSRNALGVQQRFSEAIERDDASAAQKWAIAAGISTEKVLLMRGRPTEIVANLHAHRHELGDVMDKLATAARVLSVHERKGYRQHRELPVPASDSAVENVSVLDSDPANSATDEPGAAGHS